MSTLFMRLRLRARIILATMALVSMVVALTGGLFLYLLNDTLRVQIGENALDVARAVARNPLVREAMRGENPSSVIQPYAERIREATGADFIVVGNEIGIRYSHPDPTKLGQPMVGGDNAPALLEGKEYVSVATGTLGPSMRGKVPIFDEQGRVIGVVSVGFLLSGVNKVVLTYGKNLWLVLLLGLAVGIPGAFVFASSIKRATHGLEPEEIAGLAEHQSAILSAIREGIIAIDRNERVVVANETAREMMPGLAVGMPIRDALPNSRMPDVLREGKPQYDQQMLIGDIAVVTNRVPVTIDGKVQGVVASFRDRTELARMSRELSDTRRYTEELRAQGHEFANTLQAISGMLQLGRVEEAVQFIQDADADYREIVEGLPRSVAEPSVAGLLLGKRAKAQELRCQFIIDPRSRLASAVADPTLLVRVVGNLVDNALEAAQDTPAGERRVRVYLSDEDGELTVEVADSGPGIPLDSREEVFREGFSTKAPGRGIGLALVKRLVERAGGQIMIDQAPEGGAVLRVTIPRTEEG